MYQENLENLYFENVSIANCNHFGIFACQIITVGCKAVVRYLSLAD